MSDQAKKWYPNVEQDDWAAECRFDLHAWCHGNADLYAGGQRYDSYRCACTCHAGKGLRRSTWPHVGTRKQ